MLGKYDVRQANVTGRVWVGGRGSKFLDKKLEKNFDIFFGTEYLRNPSSMNLA